MEKPVVGRINELGDREREFCLAMLDLMVSVLQGPARLDSPGKGEAMPKKMKAKKAKGKKGC